MPSSADNCRWFRSAGQGGDSRLEGRREGGMPMDQSGVVREKENRQTNSFIDNSTESGILLGGNGVSTPWEKENKYLQGAC
jgi:hypothetical protein